MNKRLAFTIVFGLLLAGVTSQAMAIGPSVGKPVNPFVGLDILDSGTITLDELGNISGSFNGFFGPYDVSLAHIASTVNPAWVDGANNPLEVTSYLVTGMAGGLVGPVPIQLEPGTLGVAEFGVPVPGLLSDALIFTDLGLDSRGFGLTRIDFLSENEIGFTMPVDFVVQEDINDMAVHRAFGTDNAERMTYFIDSSAADSNSGVPEPATLFVWGGLGLVSLGFVALRKKYSGA